MSKVIARNGDRVLIAVDDEVGYVKDTVTGKRYPKHSILSILAKGYWESVEENKQLTVTFKGGRRNLK